MGRRQDLRPPEAQVLWCGSKESCWALGQPGASRAGGWLSELRLSTARVWGRVTNRARCWREQLQLHPREQYLYVHHVESIESHTLEFLRHFSLPLTHRAQKLFRTGKEWRECGSLLLNSYLVIFRPPVLTKMFTPHPTGFQDRA